jgi:hypothetical protein
MQRARRLEEVVATQGKDISRADADGALSETELLPALILLRLDDQATAAKEAATSPATPANQQ